MGNSRFITRVQLHEAQATDFEKLDLEMQRESFIRVHEDRKPGERQPLIEYNVHGHSILDVNGAVSRAVAKTGKKYSYTVIKEKRNALQQTEKL